MEKLISLEKIIETCKEEKIDLGKGNPYNHLRYLTKIGWIPHMIRKKDKNGSVTGHYPDKTIDILKKITKYRESGLSNEEIAEKLNKETEAQNTSSKQNFNINTITIIVTIGIVILVGISILLKTTYTKGDFRNNQSATTPSPQSNIKIIETGTATVAKNLESLEIETKSDLTNSEIHITFEDNYAPANKFWTEKDKEMHKFKVVLDKAVFNDAKFTWFISEVTN